MNPILSSRLRVDCWCAPLGDDDPMGLVNEWLAADADVEVLDTKTFVQGIDGIPHVVVLIWWQALPP